MFADKGAASTVSVPSTNMPVLTIGAAADAKITPWYLFLLDKALKISAETSPAAVA